METPDIPEDFRGLTVPEDVVQARPPSTATAEVRGPWIPPDAEQPRPPQVPQDAEQPRPPSGGHESPPHSNFECLDEGRLSDRHLPQASFYPVDAEELLHEETPMPPAPSEEGLSLADRLGVPEHL